MSRPLRLLAAATLAGSFLICQGCPGIMFTFPPVQTGFSAANLSKRFYATVGVREHRQAGGEGEFFFTPLLAPGAGFRGDFFNALGNGCPDFIDLRLFLFRRIHDDVPIGLDPGEEVEQTPIVAGELLALPYCSIVPLVSFTISNWDAQPGTARVKLNQGTPFDDCYRAVGDYADDEDCIRAAGLFLNDDAAWELEGVDPKLADAAPPPLETTVPIAGRVTLDDGTAVSGVGVLLRTAFRVRLGALLEECPLPSDAGEDDDPDAGYSDPIAFTTTDENGGFSLDRPAGGYQVEFFSDDHTFRPAVICVEAPISVIQTIAEECDAPCTDN